MQHAYYVAYRFVWTDNELKSVTPVPIYMYLDLHFRRSIATEFAGDLCFALGIRR